MRSLLKCGTRNALTTDERFAADSLADDWMLFGWPLVPLASAIAALLRALLVCAGAVLLECTLSRSSEELWRCERTEATGGERTFCEDLRLCESAARGETGKPFAEAAGERASASACEFGLGVRGAAKAKETRADEPEAPGAGLALAFALLTPPRRALLIVGVGER